jgi:hypothetical protein
MKGGASRIWGHLNPTGNQYIRVVRLHFEFDNNNQFMIIKIICGVLKIELPATKIKNHQFYYMLAIPVG